MKTFNWRAYDHYAYAAVATLGTLVAIYALHWLMLAPSWSDWVHSLGGVAAPFTNVVGILFGLTLAFLANDTWTAHDRASNAVLQEADSIRSLVILSRLLTPSTQAALRAAIAEYGRASIAEWPFLARGTTNPAALSSSDQLLSLVADRSVGSAVGDIVQQQMLNHATGIRANRDLRIGLSQTHVNPLKWLGMAFLGFLTLLSVAVVNVENARAALTAMILFGLAGAPTAAIVLIHGNPFQPPSAVSPTPIAESLP